MRVDQPGAGFFDPEAPHFISGQTVWSSSFGYHKLRFGGRPENWELCEALNTLLFTSDMFYSLLISINIGHFSRIPDRSVALPSPRPSPADGRARARIFCVAAGNGGGNRRARARI